MAWSTLAYLLTDLAAEPEKSKQVIKMLLEELEKWVLKVEDGPYLRNFRALKWQMDWT